MGLSKKVIVIGSGFAGLSAASFMAKDGWDVTVMEKNNTPGGRARQLKENGFVFDMGPSFYWMPDVFERYFAQFGKKVSDYYKLTRLDPSYRIYWNDGFTDIPADINELKNVFESIEPGSASQLDKYLEGALINIKSGLINLFINPVVPLLSFLIGKLSEVFLSWMFLLLLKSIFINIFNIQSSGSSWNFLFCSLAHCRKIHLLYIA